MFIDGREAFRLMLADKMMLLHYAYIMRTVDKVNVEDDPDFQKAFNGFYGVRLPETSCYKGFYRVFEQSKRDRSILTYGAIVYELYSVTGRVEASFASKIFATLNPNQPVWDSRVLKYLGVELSGFR